MTQGPTPTTWMATLLVVTAEGGETKGWGHWAAAKACGCGVDLTGAAPVKESRKPSQRCEQSINEYNETRLTPHRGRVEVPTRARQYVPRVRLRCVQDR